MTCVRLADTKGTKMHGKVMVGEMCWPQKSSEIIVPLCRTVIGWTWMWVSMNHLSEGWQGGDKSQPENSGEVNLLDGETSIGQLNFPLHPSVVDLVKPILSMASGMHSSKSYK